MKKIFLLLLHIINKIGALIVLMLFVLFYFIMFEVPIPFLSEKASQYIKEHYESHIDERTNFSINNIALSWNYTINRPVVLIKKIVYQKNGNEISFDKIGIYPDLVSLIFFKEFSIKKLYLDGFNFLLVEEKGKINIDFLTNANDKDKKSSTKESAKINKEKNSISIMDTNDLYGSFVNLKKNNVILSKLDELAFANLKLLIMEKGDNFLSANIDQLIFKDYNNSFLIDMVSRISFDESSVAKVNLNLILNNKNDIKIKYDITNLELSKVQKKLKPYLSFLNDFTMKQMPFSGSINMLYNTKTGIEDLDGSINIAKGSVFNKNIFDQPLYINSLSTNLKLDKKKNMILFEDLLLKMSDKNTVNIKYLGNAISVNQIKGDIFYNINTNDVSIKDASISDYGNDISFNMNFEAQHPQFYLVDFSLKSNKLNFNYIKSLFPKKISPNLYQWIDESFKSIKINDLTLNTLIEISKTNKEISLKKINGQSSVENATFFYIDTMPSLSIENGLITFDDKSLYVSYDNLSTYNLFSSKGYIQVVDQYDKVSGYQPALKLDLSNMVGDIDKIIEYINFKPLLLANKYNIKSEQFTGRASGDLQILYSFYNQNLDDINAKLKVSDFSYKKVFQDNDITKGNFDFILTKDTLNIVGSAMYLDQAANVDIAMDWSVNPIQKYLVEFDKFNINKIDELNILPAGLINNKSGEMGLKINYTVEDNTQRVIFDINLLNSNFEVDKLNYVKSVSEPFLVYGDMILLDKMYNVKKLLITSNNFNSNLSMKLGDKLKDIAIKDFKLTNRFNLNGNFFMNDKSLKLFLRGDRLDISTIMDFMNKDNSKNKKEVNNNTTDINDTNKDVSNNNSHTTNQLEEDRGNILSGNSNGDIMTDLSNGGIKEYYVDIDLKRIYNNKKYIKNVVFKLDFSDKMLYSLFFNANFNSKSLSYITFNSSSNMIASKMENVGYIMSFFDIADNIKNGDLEANVFVSTDTNPKTNKKELKTIGDIVVNNIIIGVNFTQISLSFDGLNDYFNVKKLSLNGNMLGGEMMGYYDMSKNYLDLNGKLVPIWGASKLLSTLPFIKDLLKDKNEEQNGIVNFNSYIRGPLNNLDYSLFRGGSNVKADTSNGNKEDNIKIINEQELN